MIDFTFLLSQPFECSSSSQIKVVLKITNFVKSSKTSFSAPLTQKCTRVLRTIYRHSLQPLTPICSQRPQQSACSRQQPAKIRSSQLHPAAASANQKRPQLPAAANSSQQQPTAEKQPAPTNPDQQRQPAAAVTALRSQEPPDPTRKTSTPTED